MIQLAFLILLFSTTLLAQDCAVNNGGCTDRHDCTGAVGAVTCTCKSGLEGNSTRCIPSYTYRSLGCYVQQRGANPNLPVYGINLGYGYDPKSCFLACVGYKYFGLVNIGLCTCGNNDNYGRFGTTGGCVDGKGRAWAGNVYAYDAVMVAKEITPSECSSPHHFENLKVVTDGSITADSCAALAKANTNCWTSKNTWIFALYTTTNNNCYCDKKGGMSRRLDKNPTTGCHKSYTYGVKCIDDTDCLDNFQCTNEACAPCPICDGVDSTCSNVQAGTGKCPCSKCLDKNVPMLVDNCSGCDEFINLGVKSATTGLWTAQTCMATTLADSRCYQVPSTREKYFFMHNFSHCYCVNDGCNPGRVYEKNNANGQCVHRLYKVGSLAPCNENPTTALLNACECGSTKNCAAGKYCWNNACHDIAKNACPVDFNTPLTSACHCGTDTSDCAVGKYCYENTCKNTPKCDARTDVHKNLFYGAKVYGKWNATAKRMYMNFTTPWDITVSKIKWKNTADITMQFLGANAGLWKKDKTTDPCKCTYHLDVPQTTFFGAGSNFTITGSQLRTNLRVDASENIQTVKNQQTYVYTRNIKNTVPVLVNLVTRTTIAVRFRSTAAPPGPGPAPALEDFVLFVGAEDYFATDDPHVLITMKVHSRTCVDHALPDTGVRVKTGADNIKTGSTQTFNWLKDSNGDIIAPYEHNLCVEELSWKFYPKKYKENTYEIELEFDLKNLPQKFTTIAAIDIKQADVLADIGFTSTINVYNNSNCTAESKNNKVILGHKFYTKIVLTDMVIDAKNITCNTYKIKQTKAGSTFETDMKGEVKYAFEEKHIISPTVKNSHICGAELESHHFHVSVDGYDTVLETEIEIYYDQTNSRRKLVTIPISHNMWDDEIWEAEVGMSDDGFEEVGIGATEYDDEDKLFRETKRAPDQDDMVVNLFVETESAKGAAVGTFMDTDSTQLFLTMSLCILVVGALGFVFGYSQTKSASYREIPDNYNSLLVEMK